MRRFTLTANPTLTLVCLPATAPLPYSLEAAAELTGVHPALLLYYCRAGLVDTLHGEEEAELLFEASALLEIRRIEHYRRHLGVGRRALRLVCELQRQADRQHIELRFLD